MKSDTQLGLFPRTGATAASHVAASHYPGTDIAGGFSAGGSRVQDPLIVQGDALLVRVRALVHVHARSCAGALEGRQQ